MNPRRSARSPLPRTRGAFLLCAALALPGMTSCVSDQQPATAKSPGLFDTGGGAIAEINVLAIPVALNLDNAPGVDGFVIKIYASNRNRPKPLPIESGQVEVLMFDGIPGRGNDASLAPLKTWTYSAEDLKPLEIQSSIGIGYQVAPVWDTAKPQSNKITVAVRYTSKQGTVVTSAPSVISVAIK